MPDKMSFYMLSTGRMINAEEALQAGLVSRLCSKIEIETVVEETIQAIENTSRLFWQLIRFTRKFRDGTLFTKSIFFFMGARNNFG